MKNAKKTMKNIAVMAGVSSATVSRVFDRTKVNLVKPRTREKILGVAKKAGFVPNIQAQYLAGTPVNTLGIVLPNSSFYINSSYVTEILRGIADETEKQGYHLMLYTTRQPLIMFDYMKLYESKITSGLILMNTGKKEKGIIQDLLAQKRPFVVVNNYFPGVSFSYVDADNVDGAAQAVRYLISRGHRKIVCLRGHLDSRNADDRVKGYLKALKENGLKAGPDDIIVGSFLETEGYGAVQAILERKEKPSAIFCSNDEMALGAIRAVKERRLRIPEDVAIVGYDDSRIAAIISPTLTTVRQPIYEIGTETVRILIDQIRNPQHKPRVKIFGTELVVRDSSG